MADLAHIRGGEIRPDDLKGIPRAELEDMLASAVELENRRLYSKIDTYYPETGPLRRELYKPHIEFFKQGATKRIRAILAANRIGKTEGVGAYEMALHLTGQYPDWWEGKRFTDPILAWTAGDTNITTRNIQQKKLLGPPGQFGTGMLRADTIKKTSPKSGVPDAIESVLVKHVSGGVSNLMFKSYEQKRVAFQGDDIEVIYVYDELSRLKTKTIGDKTTAYTWRYDNLLQRVDFPGGYVTYGYYPQGGGYPNLAYVEDRLGNRTRYYYDGADRLERVEDAEGDIPRYEYDSSGNMTAMVNAKGEWSAPQKLVQFV